MPALEDWEDAWLNNKAMPPNAFPPSLFDFLLDRLESWLDEDMHMRTQLQEFVSRKRSHEILGGLLYNGFCSDRKLPQRLRPIPVIVQMLFKTPITADESSLAAQMKFVFAQVLSEWCGLHASGEPYDIAP